MNMKGRSFIKLLDYTPEEIEYLLNLAAELYISIGDAENAAIVYLELTKQYAAAGQMDKADFYRLRAQSFAQSSHQNEVLKGLNGDSTHANQ